MRPAPGRPNTVMAGEGGCLIQSGPTIMVGPQDKRPGASLVPAIYAATVVVQMAGTRPAMTGGAE